MKRGVNLKLYKAELYLTKFPLDSRKAMKVMFAKNELTRKIMTRTMPNRYLHCCQSVYQTGQELGVKMPILEANMKGI